MAPLVLLSAATWARIVPTRWGQAPKNLGIRLCLAPLNDLPLPCIRTRQSNLSMLICPGPSVHQFKASITCLKEFGNGGIIAKSTANVVDLPAFIDLRGIRKEKDAGNTLRIMPVVFA